MYALLLATPIIFCLANRRTDVQCSAVHHTYMYVCTYVRTHTYLGCLRDCRRQPCSQQEQWAPSCLLVQFPVGNLFFFRKEK